MSGGLSCLALCALVACAYTPGSFRRFGGEFPGSRQTVGCLDVAFLGRHESVTPNPVVEFNVGNRCDHAVVVDFTAIRVRGNTGAREVELVPVDPRREIRVAQMDGRWTGREVIEYRPPAGENDPIVGLCIDLGPLDRENGRRDQWSCAPASDAAIGSAP